MRREIGPGDKTAAFLASLVLLLAAALWLPGTSTSLPGWAIRYGAALVGFTLWMWWFISTGVNIIFDEAEARD